MSDAPDLSMIATLLRQAIAEQAGMRDDMGVTMATLQRIDGTLNGLVNEVRAMQRQHARMDNRLPVLEASQPGAH